MQPRIASKLTILGKDSLELESSCLCLQSDEIKYGATVPHLGSTRYQIQCFMTPKESATNWVTATHREPSQTNVNTEDTEPKVEKGQCLSTRIQMSLEESCPKNLLT